MRHRLLLCVGVVACLSGCSQGEDSRVQLAVGAPAPSTWATDPAGVLIGWAFRPEQLITCETAAYQLRAWRGRFGSAVALSVVTIDSEAELARTFLRAQRLSDVPVKALPEKEFHRAFGSLAEPMLYVIENGRIRGGMPASRPALLDPLRVHAVELLIDSLVAGRGPESPRSSHPPIVRG